MEQGALDVKMIFNGHCYTIRIKIPHHITRVYNMPNTFRSIYVDSVFQSVRNVLWHLNKNFRRNLWVAQDWNLCAFEMFSSQNSILFSLMKAINKPAFLMILAKIKIKKFGRCPLREGRQVFLKGCGTLFTSPAFGAERSHTVFSFLFLLPPPSLVGVLMEQSIYSNCYLHK